MTLTRSIRAFCARGMDRDDATLLHLRRPDQDAEAKALSVPVHSGRSGVLVQSSSSQSERRTLRPDAAIAALGPRHMTDAKHWVDTMREVAKEQRNG